MELALPMEQESVHCKLLKTNDGCCSYIASACKVFW